MKTTNIVSAPGIEGNVGQCTTNSSQITTYGGFFVSEGFYANTNSCTGITHNVRFTQFSGPGVIVGSIVIAIVLIILCIAALSN